MPFSTDPIKTADSLQRMPDLDALTKACNAFIYICSQDYRIQYMNDKLCERTGYDATGEYCYKILHGCDDVCPWCNNDRLFSEQKPIRYQLKSPKDERWYHIINTPICNIDGSLSKQSLIMDITESYLVREELSLLQTLISHSNDAIFLIDADTSAFIYVNDKACSNLGYSTAELLTRRVIDISASFVDLPSWHSHAAHIRKKNRVFEAGHIRKDGSHLPVEVTASYVPHHEKNFIVSVVRDISDRKILEHELQRQAQSDYLTGLSNRRYFIERSEEEVARAFRYGHPMSLLMLDIDHFKDINDTHGHHAGDTALQMFAAHCQEALRETDIIGRVGGEEFAVILPETDGEGAYEIAERLCQSIASQIMTTEKGVSLGLTVSIGLTTLAVGGEANLDPLLKQADEALYKAKCTGRNRVCAFSS
ncbi:MAG: diguanylate cyclase [Proteobacteria bacterium]|nr:diguanylate cyclase [Pseudomonadota bacterium]MBU1647866.1 diguanylate cyclase [Pseudomonadota bacterium]